MEVRVSVFKRKGRKYYEAQWVDPVTGKKKTRSTKKTKKRDAVKVAGKIEAELREGRFDENRMISWAEFREQYERKLQRTSNSEKTWQLNSTTFNAVEEIIDPKNLQSLTSKQVSDFQEALFAKELSSSTVHCYLRHLKAALRWAKTKHMLVSVPSFDMPRCTEKMKGRPITREEYELLLESTASVVGETATESWRFLLRGLWSSGLRLGEALNLSWTDKRLIFLDYSGNHPVLVIPSHLQKSKKAQTVPLVPEFELLLNEVSEPDRIGFVFNPMPRRAGNGRLRLDTTSSIICQIGEAAKVVVAEAENGDKVKYASAHDFRRAFGERMSAHMMPPILKQVMRHSSINTTMKYYVGADAQRAAQILWDAMPRIDRENSPNEIIPFELPATDAESDSGTSEDDAA